MHSSQTQTLAVLLFVKRFQATMGTLLVALVLVGWLTLIGPALKGLREMRTGIRNASIERMARERFLEALGEIRVRVSAIAQADQEKLRVSIPGEVDLPQLWTFFDSIASENGMELGSVTVSEPPASAKGRGSESKIVPVSVEVVFRGSGYSTFVRLLKTMEDSVPIIGVREWMFRPELEEFKIFLHMYTLRKDSSL